MAKFEIKDGVAIIPEGTTVIGWGAFQDCTSLKSITIPKSITEIHAYAFNECSALSGGYSIKRTLPALVPSLTYKGMDVGNGGNIEDGTKEVIIYEIKFRWLNTSVR